jgi:hypothetical protein
MRWDQMFPSAEQNQATSVTGANAVFSTAQGSNRQRQSIVLSLFFLVLSLNKVLAVQSGVRFLVAVSCAHNIPTARAGGECLP